MCALHPSTLALQLRLADACVAAGVRRYVLADWGSLESDDTAVASLGGRLAELFRNKTRVKAYCAELAGASGGAFSWTSVVTGHFFDEGLRHGRLLGVEWDSEAWGVVDQGGGRKQPKGCVGRMRLFDGGKKQFSASTTAQIGRALVQLLMKEDESRDRVLYVQSFAVSQMDIANAVNEALHKLDSKEAPWLEKVTVPAEEYLEERKRDMDAGEYQAVEDVVGVLGMRARWMQKEGWAMDILGLEEENLSNVVEEVVSTI